MVNEKLKVRCIKAAYPAFSLGTVYDAKRIHIVVTSAPQLVVTDDTGYESHIIAEGYLSEDVWFNEHFEVIEPKGEMEMKTVNYTEVTTALRIALKEYDKSVILEIAEESQDGWANGCEALNGLDHNTIDAVLSTMA